MRKILLHVMPALALAGCASAQGERRDPSAPGAKTPPIEFRTAFEGYRPFAEQETQDWRKANDAVGAAGGHVGKPGGHK